MSLFGKWLTGNGGGNGSLPSNAVLFENWVGGETVTIDTGITNTAPVIASGFSTTSTNDSTNISIPYTISDSQGGSMTATYTKNGVPSTVTSLTTGSNTWNVGTLSIGSHTLSIQVKDSGNLSSNTLSFNITITATETTDTTAPVVTVSPIGGTFTSNQSVTLSTNETATIYYTLDGSTPTESSMVYSSPITINTTTTLKLFAKDTTGNASSVMTELYTINEVVSSDFLDFSSGAGGILLPTGKTFNTVEMEVDVNSTATGYLLDLRAGSGGSTNSYAFNGGVGAGISTYSINGVAGTDKTTHWANIPKNQKSTLKYIATNAVTTGGGSVAMRSVYNDQFAKIKVYTIKVYNGATLVASYDLTTQFAGTTIADTSGNGNNATIFGTYAWGTN